MKISSERGVDGDQMTGHSRPHPSPQLITGHRKFLRDVCSIFEIRFILIKRSWHWYLMGTLVFPIGMFYFASALAPDNPDAVRRAMVGTIVFGATMLTTAMLGQNVLMDRFQGRLKLIITMPVSKTAYAGGILSFGAILTGSAIAVLLGVAPLVGVELSLTWSVIPIALTVLLTMSGLTMLVVSYAPSPEVGGIMSNLLGIFLALVSPVYFPMEQAPAVMRALGWISPLRYAADGMMKSLSGSTDVLVEVSILAVFALVFMTAGLWKLRWREV